MSTALIKEELHKYIDKGDEKLLKLIYLLVREYQYDELSVSDIAELENRTAKRKSGKSKIYDLQQTKDMITGKVAIKP